jgi:uncharacterized protein (DUF1778 family)
MQMSRGPVIYDTTLTVAMSSDQKEEIRRAATKIGSTLGVFTRSVLIKEATRIKKAA